MLILKAFFPTKVASTDVMAGILGVLAWLQLVVLLAT